ncbi:ubiquitin carboxyl-terminal hydrolase family protein [Striga asiatica]|uniref:Ubiquitin carboxyl-terminal hydrolase family protein n=1 Tax=Striga asiatica TaxID=4170 RepID=A0A5A7QAS5_STRAF|nr:ubiquitin carboxyl-terminal hydrolase family protein [Striga asiatica]
MVGSRPRSDEGGQRSRRHKSFSVFATHHRPEVLALSEPSPTSPSIRDLFHVRLLSLAVGAARRLETQNNIQTRPSSSPAIAHAIRSDEGGQRSQRHKSFSVFATYHWPEVLALFEPSPTSPSIRNLFHVRLLPLAVGAARRLETQNVTLR